MPDRHSHHVQRIYISRGPPRISHTRPVLATDVRRLGRHSLADAVEKEWDVHPAFEGAPYSSCLPECFSEACVTGASLSVDQNARSTAQG